MEKKKQKNTCFVCKAEIAEATSVINHKVMLPVCKSCSGTEKEKKAAEDLLDSLADGLVCGCM